MCFRNILAIVFCIVEQNPYLLLSKQARAKIAPTRVQLFASLVRCVRSHQKVPFFFLHYVSNTFLVAALYRIGRWIDWLAKFLNQFITQARWRFCHRPTSNIHVRTACDSPDLRVQNHSQHSAQFAKTRNVEDEYTLPEHIKAVSPHEIC
jgi:hypothetical protein